MPVFNRYKLVNFKYGTSTDRLLSNKTMVLDGDNLQIEASNTIGKSMSIQTIIQSIYPLSDVAKPFVEVYTRREPVYALTEWLLDDNKTLVLTGVGFERKPSSGAEYEGKPKKESLYRCIQFTIERSADIGVDIDNIPLMVKDVVGNNVVKSLDSIEKYVKELQAKHGRGRVSIYKGYSSSRKEYKRKLLEYGIYQDEWRDVIVRLNDDNKEGGLSEFIKKYNTTEKLIRDSILPIVESSLKVEYDDGEKTPIVVLRENIRSFIENVISMKDKLADHENYLELQNIVNEVDNKLSEVLSSKDNLDDIYERLANLYACIENKKASLFEEIEGFKKESILKKEELTNVKYEEESYNYHTKCKNIIELNEKKSVLDDEVLKENKIKDNLEKDKCILEYQFKHSLKEQEELLKKKKESERERKGIEYKEIVAKLGSLGSSIHGLLKKQILNLESDMALNRKTVEEKRKLCAEYKSNIQDLIQEISNIQSKNVSIRDYENRYASELNEFKKRNSDTEEFSSDTFFGVAIDYNGYREFVNSEIVCIDTTISDKNTSMSENKKTLSELKTEVQNLTSEKGDLDLNLKTLKKRKIEIKKIEDLYNKIALTYNIEEKLFDVNAVKGAIKEKISEFEIKKTNLEDDRRELYLRLESLENLKDIYFDKEILLELASLGIYPVEGVKYLVNTPGDFEYKKSLVEKNPVLPYSIILTEKEYNILQESDIKSKLTSCIPIFVRSSLEEPLVECINSNLVKTESFDMLVGFDINSIDPIRRENLIAEIKQNISKSTEYIDDVGSKLKELNTFILKFDICDYSSEDFTIDSTIEELEHNIIQVVNNISTKESLSKKVTLKNQKLADDIISLNSAKNTLNNKLMDLDRLEKSFEEVLESRDILENNNFVISNLEKDKSVLEDKVVNVEELVNNIMNEIATIKVELNNRNTVISKFVSYKPSEANNGDSLESLMVEFDTYAKDSTSREVADLNSDISTIENRLIQYNKELSDILKRVGDYSKEPLKKKVILTEDEIDKKIAMYANSINEKSGEVSALNSEILKLEGTILNIRENIAKNFDGKEPCELSVILNYNFKLRVNNINDDLKNIKDILKENEVLLGRYSSELRYLNKYAVEGKAIVSQPKNVFEESKSLQNILDKTVEKYNKCISAYNDAITTLRTFDISCNNIYSKYIEILMVNKDAYIKQSEQIDIVKSVIRQEIAEVEKHTEHVNQEKSIIVRKIKDYILDCVDELRIINKLGTHKGQDLFKIVLPKQDKILERLSKIDILVDDMIEESSLDDISKKINTFYILNYTLGLSTLPVNVIKYEINHRGPVAWEDIPNKTTGAQRFCISFIVTVILMEYKRYNKNSVLGGKNFNGKVLLMDNPFGETSESDFLQEIFELASKFKVQIISYTHIKNESVRAMFKRIYGMTVHKTPSKKEFVEIEALRGEEENVRFSPFIKHEVVRAVDQSSLFDIG